jgi:integrase
MLKGIFMVFANLPTVTIIDWEVNKVARRRFQRGALARIKNKNKADSWKLTFRVDVLQSNGTIKREYRSFTFGTVEDFPTEKIARRVADTILAKEGINNVDYRPTQQATMEEMVVLYKREILPTMKLSTKRGYESLLDKYIIPMFGRVRVDLLGNLIVQGAVRQLSEKGLSVQSIKNILMLLKSILQAAKDWGFNVGNFEYSAVKMPKRIVAQQGATYTENQALDIIDKAPYPINLMLLTIGCTGLRMGEVLALKWSNIDLEQGFLKVTQTVWQGKFQLPKSLKSQGTIPLPKILINNLLDYKDHYQHNVHDLLWVNGAGNPHDGNNIRSKILRPILNELGIKKFSGFHAFRHLHTSLLLEKGASIKVAQNQLRHSDPRTTLDIYAHVIGEEHREAVESSATVFNPIATNLRTRQKNI